MHAHLTPTHCAECGAFLNLTSRTGQDEVFHPFTNKTCPHAGHLFHRHAVKLEHADGRPADHPRDAQPEQPAAPPSTETAPLPSNPQPTPTPTLPPPPSPTRGSEEVKSPADAAKKIPKNNSTSGAVLEKPQKEFLLKGLDDGKSFAWMSVFGQADLAEKAQELVAVGLARSISGLRVLIALWREEARVLLSADDEKAVPDATEEVDWRSHIRLRGLAGGRAMCEAMGYDPELGRKIAPDGLAALTWTKPAFDAILAAGLRLADRAMRALEYGSVEKERAAFERDLALAMRGVEDSAPHYNQVPEPVSRVEVTDFCVAVMTAAEKYAAQILEAEKRMPFFAQRETELRRLWTVYDREIKKLVEARESEWERDYAGMREMQHKYINADQWLRALKLRYAEQQAKTFEKDPRWQMWRVAMEEGRPVYRVPRPEEYVISVSGFPELSRHIGDCGERVILERVEDVKK